MPRCPKCDERLPSDRDRAGARCPHCREPLYERGGVPRRRDGDADGQCATHPEAPSLGTCQRCGNFYCATCRTRWRGQVLCLACVERALDLRETSPEEAKTHFRLAVWSLVCGLGGWVLALFGVLFFFLGLQAGPDNPRIVLILPGVACLGLSPFASIPGIGLGAAAIRARGDHLILATAGLVLSCLEAGAFIGFCGLSFWRN